MTFEIGQEVGNYRILKRLGCGGMGEVFLAEHPLIGETVALKVIHQDMNLNKELVARFVNEAKAVSTIGNDHIVDVHDFGTTPEGAHFFIMEYLEGETLAAALSNGRLSLSDPSHVESCLHIGAQVAAGLAAAHAHNIIHRDLKPDNIMLIHKLGDPIFVKILDFGLAKMMEAEQPLTAMGVVLGTPEFMSPEAAESKGIDGRSDIYSFGVLLFFMLTGRLPFESGSMGEIMVQHVCQAPPVPRSFNPAIPPAVEQIVLRCLAKRKEDRFSDMDVLRAALMDSEEYLATSPRVVASNGASESISSQRARQPHPDMVHPARAAPHTMSIGTPAGHKKQGRRMGTLLAVALLSGSGGVAVALSQTDAKRPAVAAEVPSPVFEPPSMPTVLAPQPVVGDDAGAPTTLSIHVNSNPPGVAVRSLSGALVGTTPFDWETFATGDEVVWSFAHKGYGEQTHRFVPDDESPIEVILLMEPAETPDVRERPRPKRPRPLRPRPKPAKQVNNNLLEPDI